MAHANRELNEQVPIHGLAGISEGATMASVILSVQDPGTDVAFHN